MPRAYIRAADLVQWLRATSRYQGDSHYRAAVDLLANHNGGFAPLLHNEEFQRIAVKGTYRNGLWVDWRAARRAMNAKEPRLPTGGSEAGVLRMAIALGLDEFEISSLDSENRALLVEAVSTAISRKRVTAPLRSVPDVQP